MEVALYQPVKAFLEGLGFAVKGELCGCDVFGTRSGGAPEEKPVRVIAELKQSFSLELLLQAADRLALADEVWLAVIATRRGRDRDRRVHKLCRLLGVGLLAVDVARNRVEMLVEPAPYRPRPNLRRQGRLMQEYTRRRGDPMQGGSTRRPIMTAYRQQALDIAAGLHGGAQRPRDLRAHAPDAGRILASNVYGWFDRVATGLYRLTPSGEKALAEHCASAATSPGAIAS